MIHDNGYTTDISAVVYRLGSEGVTESVNRDAPGNPGPSESRPPCGSKIFDLFAVVVDHPFAALVFRPPCPELGEQIAP